MLSERDKVDGTLMERDVSCAVRSAELSSYVSLHFLNSPMKTMNDNPPARSLAPAPDT